MLRIMSFAIIFFMITSCARRWEIYYKEEKLSRTENEKVEISNEENMDSLRESKYIGQIEYASNKEYILCYLTVIAYGGYCWYMRFGAPNSSDIDEVKREAVVAFPELDLKTDEIIVRPR